jgi:hypothetical protein
MPAKLITICYVHDLTERLTQDFTIKEITGIARLDEDDPKKIAFLRIKAFIPSNRNTESQIKQFNTGDVIFLKGKFVASQSWYSVCLPNFTIPHF